VFGYLRLLFASMEQAMNETEQDLRASISAVAHPHFLTRKMHISLSKIDYIFSFFCVLSLP